MVDLQQIISSVHNLSPQEKLTLRSVLERELIGSAPAQNGTKPLSELIGLFANESDVLDHVMDSVYEGRGRPWRAA
jgi:hypothetical protein